jgi:ribosomal protein L11 methyltransferase
VADVFRQACPGGATIESSTRFDPSSNADVIDGDATAVVRGYVPDDGDTSRLRDSLRIALKMAPFQSPPRWRRVRHLKESDWRNSWKKHFGIQRVGRSLVVKPSWTQYRLKGGEIVLEIDPGMAFGTGQHPTTAMCLRALEDLVRPGMSLLDLGCGSGILAIAAAKLGAARVLALDIDPNAVRAARENAAANAVAPVVDVREETLGDGETFDLVVANISGLTLERLAPAIAGSINPAGVLITSGFLEDAVGGLTQAYDAAGLAVDSVVGEGVWRSIIARA